jgi:hypothetical protein
LESKEGHRERGERGRGDRCRREKDGEIKRKRKTRGKRDKERWRRGVGGWMIFLFYVNKGVPSVQH